MQLFVTYTALTRTRTQKGFKQKQYTNIHTILQLKKPNHEKSAVMFWANKMNAMKHRD